MLQNEPEIHAVPGPRHPETRWGPDGDPGREVVSLVQSLAHDVLWS